MILTTSPSLCGLGPSCSDKLHKLLDSPLQESGPGMETRIGIPTQMPATDPRGTVVLGDRDDDLLFLMALARAEETAEDGTA